MPENLYETIKPYVNINDIIPCLKELYILINFIELVTVTEVLDLNSIIDDKSLYTLIEEFR